MAVGEEEQLFSRCKECEAGAGTESDTYHMSENALPKCKRVLLADDNAAILKIVRETLEPEFEVVGAVTDGESVLREASAVKPDVVVLDISMGEPDGISVARRLKATAQKIKVVFLTVHERAEFIRSAFAGGGSGYVFKSRLSMDLIPAIRAACDGRVFVSCREMGTQPCGLTSE